MLVVEPPALLLGREATGAEGGRNLLARDGLEGGLEGEHLPRPSRGKAESAGDAARHLSSAGDAATPHPSSISPSFACRASRAPAGAPPSSFASRVAGRWRERKRQRRPRGGLPRFRSSRDRRHRVRPHPPRLMAASGQAAPHLTASGSAAPPMSPDYRGARVFRRQAQPSWACWRPSGGLLASDGRPPR